MSSEIKGDGRTPPPSTRVGRLDTSAGVLREMSRVYRQARQGKLDAQTACRLTYILTSMGRIWETVEFERRLQALEKRSGS